MTIYINRWQSMAIDDNEENIVHRFLWIIDFYGLSILSIDYHEQLNPNIPLQSIENEAKKTSDRIQCSSDPARFAFRLLS